MKWEDIAGHTGVIKILKNMLGNKKVPHALLFVGPAGVGKSLAARILAAGLLCDGDPAAKPCGGCPACCKVEQGSHPDLVVLPSDGTSLKIDQMRELQHEAAFAPYLGEHRVFVIEEADRLTPQAASSLLKTLEEPPAGTVFILTSVSPYALLPTIVSRCLLLAFHPLPAAELNNLLCLKGVSPERAAVAARLAGGRVGPALAVLQPEGLVVRDRAAGLLAALPDAGTALIWETTARQDKLESSELKDLLGSFSYILRDLLVILLGQDILIFNLDIKAKLSDMAAAWDVAALIRALEDIRLALRALEANASPRLTWEALMIKLIGAAGEGKNNANSCWDTV